MADRQASIAHLTDAVGLPRQEPNDLMFVKPNLAEAELDVSKGGQKQIEKVSPSHRKLGAHVGHVVVFASFPPCFDQ